MNAVVALYSTEDHKLAESIVASLSHAIFNGNDIRPAGRLKKIFSRLSYRILCWTTKTARGRDGTGTTICSNALMERSGHPYAQALLVSSKIETASLVEGGDPMNGPYMMIPPEIRKNGGLLDNLFLDSVQGRDVQSRIIWETRATYETAKRWLDKGEPVRLKAVAAGTGLSMILVYDKLIRDGYNPNLITAKITDRDEANTDKANRLLNKLFTTNDQKFAIEKGHGILAETEDVFGGNAMGGTTNHAQFHVVTAIGIFEYFQGFSYTTTEEKLNLKTSVESPTAQDLAMRLAEMTTDHASLIVNTYRDDASTRIMELFGKRFDYRNREDLRSLMASVDFRPARLAGSGNIYDVEVYEKNFPPV